MFDDVWEPATTALTVHHTNLRDRPLLLTTGQMIKDEGNRIFSKQAFTDNY